MKCPKCHTDNPDDSKFCKECATPLPSAREAAPPTETMQAPIKELTTGTTFANRYQVIEELGKGGMGRVYKVFDTKIKDKVALKLIKPEVASDRETIERFGNELKFARQIGHRHVCRMFDLGEAEGAHFITMEYVHGEDLKTMIRMSGQLGVGTTIHIAKQICEGLAEAHRLGVVHRDLKSSNIMIDREGNVRIMDFGIARRLKERGITGAGVIIGTPEYMSPEQVDGKDVDARSDIYSLGVILYEMLTGHVPFEGDTPFTIGIKHKSEAPKDPRQLNAQIPENFSQVVLKCLEKDWAKRYQSAGEVLAELQKIETGVPTTEIKLPGRPLTSKEITVKFTPKKLIVPIVGVVALIVMLAILLRVLPKKEAPPPAPVPSKFSIAVLPFENLGDPKEDEAFSTGITEDITTQLSKISELDVRSHTSAIKYKETEKGTKEIGRELNVAYLLDGSIRRADNTVRITARLIDAATDKNIWAENYDKELKDIFTIQSDIALKIASELRAKIAPAEKERIEKKPTENLKAYEFYLKGREYFDRYRKVDNEQAIELFNKALELDPSYALAYAGTADAYSQRAYRYGYPETWFDKAIEIGQKAISLDPNLAEAYRAVALGYWGKGWCRKAIEMGQKAVDLNPNSYLSLGALGYWHAARGEYDKALPLANKAMTVSPAWAYPCSVIALCHFGIDDYQQAEEWSKKSLELQPDFDNAHVILINSYLAAGRQEEAVLQCQKFLSLVPDGTFPFLYAGCAELFAGRLDRAQSYLEKAGSIASVDLGYVYWKMGKRDGAKKLLQSVLVTLKNRIDSGDEYWDTTYQIAAIHAILGNKEEALEWLQKTIDAGYLFYRYLEKDPMFENVRDDGRFQEIIERTKARVDEMRRRVEKTNKENPK